jgi:hypothetical protein
MYFNNAEYGEKVSDGFGIKPLQSRRIIVSCQVNHRQPPAAVIKAASAWLDGRN